MRVVIPGGCFALVGLSLFMYGSAIRPSVSPVRAAPAPTGKSFGGRPWNHGHWVMSISATPHGVRSEGINGLRLWNSDDGRLLYRLDHDGQAYSNPGQAHHLARTRTLFPDPGQQNQQPLWICDVIRSSDLEIVSSIERPLHQIQVALFPDSTVLALCYRDEFGQTLDLVEPQSGRTLHSRRLQVERSGTPMLQFSSDSRYLIVKQMDSDAAGHPFCTLHFVMVRGKPVPNDFPTRTIKPVYAVETTSDPDLLLILSDKVLFYQPVVGKTIHTMPWPEFTRAVCLSPDGKRLAAVCGDGQAYLYSVPDGIEVWRTDTNEGCLTAVSFSRDDREVLTGSQFGVVRKWDAASGREILPPATSPAAAGFCNAQGVVDCVAVSPDGQTIAIGHQFGAVTVIDVPTGKQTAVLNDEVHGPENLRYDIRAGFVAFTADGRRLLSSRGRNQPMGVINLWDTETLTLETTTEPYEHLVNDVQATRVWNQFASHSSGNVNLHASDGAVVASLEPEDVASLSYSWDGEFLSTVGKAVQIWDTANGGLVRELPLTGLPAPIAVSAASRTAVLADDVSLHIRNLDNNSLDHSVAFKRRSRVTRSVVLSPDGETIVVSQTGGRIGFWDLDGVKLGEIQPHTEDVTSLTWWPDGTALVTAGLDHRVCINDVRQFLSR